MDTAEEKGGGRASCRGTGWGWVGRAKCLGKGRVQKSFHIHKLAYRSL